MTKERFDIIMIGGSAGSIPIIIQILKGLPLSFSIPVVVVIHRLKNVISRMDDLLTSEIKIKKIIEPNDKTMIEAGAIYLAPQNYHLLIEKDYSFSLDYSEPVNFSRPSINVSFESASKIYKQHTVAVLLTGANKDGAEGMETVVKAGGLAIVQSLETAEYKEMPMAAIEKKIKAHIFSPQQITTFLSNL